MSSQRACEASRVYAVRQLPCYSSIGPARRTPLQLSWALTICAMYDPLKFERVNIPWLRRRQAAEARTMSRKRDGRECNNDSKQKRTPGNGHIQVSVIRTCIYWLITAGAWSATSRSTRKKAYRGGGSHSPPQPKAAVVLLRGAAYWLRRRGLRAKGERDGRKISLVGRSRSSVERVSRRERKLSFSQSFLAPFLTPRESNWVLTQ